MQQIFYLSSQFLYWVLVSAAWGWAAPVGVVAAAGGEAYAAGSPPAAVRPEQRTWVTGLGCSQASSLPAAVSC